MVATTLLAADGDAVDTIFGSVQTAISGFVGQYGAAVAAVIGAGALLIGLAVWGVPKLVGVFRKSAK